MPRGGPRIQVGLMTSSKPLSGLGFVGLRAKTDELCHGSSRGATGEGDVMRWETVWEVEGRPSAMDLAG